MKNLLVSAAIIGGLFAGVHHADAAETETVRPYKPCAYEDSINCVWDAQHMGNGEGRSFLVLRSEKRQPNGTFIKVIYMPHRAAHLLLAR